MFSKMHEGGLQLISLFPWESSRGVAFLIQVKLKVSNVNNRRMLCNPPGGISASLATVFKYAISFVLFSFFAFPYHMQIQV
jgi:hypothetical protein